MTAEAFVETIRDDTKTPLSRLGSSKSLYADTGGKMEPDIVVAAAIADEQAFADVLEDWAEDTDGPLGDAYADAAGVARDHVETIEGRTDADIPEPSAIYAEMSEFSTPIERLGAFVGRTIVEMEKTTQRTGYFTGQADPQTSQLFRTFKTDLESQRDQAVDLLAGQCADEDDWETAQNAATAVIQAAYDEYVETLEGMGVNPKNVC